MVLPLLIIGAIVIGGGYILTSGGGSQIAEAINRTTKSKARKEHELETDKYELKKNQRGVFDNIYAFFAGEQALKNTYEPTKQANPASVETGRPHQTPAEHQYLGFKSVKNLPQTGIRNKRIQDG